MEIPVAFYKILIDEQNNTIRTLAIIMPQDVQEGEAIELFIPSIDIFEEQTHIDILTELPDNIEDEIEAETAIQLWE